MEPGLLVFVIVILPILSACLGFTVHYAIRPMVESLVDALHDLRDVPGVRESGDRVARLEAEVGRLRDDVRRLERAATSDAEFPNLPEETLGLPGGSA